MKAKFALFLTLHFLLLSNYMSQEQIDSVIQTVGNDFKQISANENRHVVGFSVSNNQNPLILQNPSALLTPFYTRGFDVFTLVDALYLNYQYNTKKNIFLEVGAKYLKYYFGFETNEWLIENGIRSSFESLYSTFSFDLGMGHSFKTKRNRDLINLHAGLNLGITDNKVGSTGMSNEQSIYTDAMGNEGLFSIQSSYVITNRTRVTIYTGFSKDIKITDNLFLTLRYNRTFGRRMTFSEHNINYSLSTFNIQNQVKANLSVKGQMYAIGIRWFF